MKKSFIITIALLASLTIMAQSRYVSVAAFNTQSAMPFGKFLGSFTDQFHPGIEAACGQNISSAKKHDWFLELLQDLYPYDINCCISVPE